MNSVIHTRKSVTSTRSGRLRSIHGPIALLVSMFFLFGLITVFNVVLVPYLRDFFQLSHEQAVLVKLSFFAAYFIVALPSSSYINRVGYQGAMVTGLIILAVGCVSFYPAVMLMSYSLFLLSIIVMASGITLLQVAANPYLSSLGANETASVRLSLAGGFNSMATVLVPLVGADLILSSTAPSASAGYLPYLGLALVVLMLAIITRQIRLPSLEHNQGKFSVGVLAHRNLRLGIIAIFLYVGAEVAVGTLLIRFLMHEHLLGMSATLATRYISLYWAGAMIGRIAGVSLLSRINTSNALTFVGFAAVLLIFIGVNSPAHIALWAFLAIGLFNSIMWPCIFPLAIKGLHEHTSVGAGLLIMGVVGGAIIPLVQGMVAGWLDIQISFIVAGFCYAYLIFYGLCGHKTSAF
ncbi:MAG: sugar MFS transporter [Cyclobacteriaceae bacterium]